MKQYIKNYVTHHNIGEQDILLCKLDGSLAADIHHIKYKSRGGSDEVDNLIALCRSCHNKAHANILTEEFLKTQI